MLALFDHVFDIEIDADCVLDLMSGYVVALVESVGSIAVDDGTFAYTLVP